MQGTIVNYRGSHKTQHPNQMIIKVEGVNDKAKALELLNKTIIWTSPADKKITGKIKDIHGNKGALRVIFEKGLPGQALGGKVEIS